MAGKPKQIFWVEIGQWTDLEPDNPKSVWSWGRKSYPLRYSERGGGKYTSRGHALNRVKQLRGRGYLEAKAFVADCDWREVDVHGGE